MHAMYMGRTARKVRPTAEPLRWRETSIRKWREAAGLTLERAADRLSHSPYYLETTHTSLQRIEAGKQMPKVEMIEALAHLYKTDIHSLLNLNPPAR